MVIPKDAISGGSSGRNEKPTIDSGQYKENSSNELQNRYDRNNDWTWGVICLDSEIVKLDINKIRKKMVLSRYTIEIA